MDPDTEIPNPIVLENRHVHQVYDAIAEQFNSTRRKAWPRVLEFLKCQSPDALGADVGCGNGKYLLALSKEHKQSAKNNVESELEMSSVISKLETTTMKTKPPLSPNDLVPLLLASDRSPRFAEIVRTRGFDVIVCDCLRLPYVAGRLDYFICIAVIHHLSTQARRVQAVTELARVLKPGGRGLIQVWAKEQRDPFNSRPSVYIRDRQQAVGALSGACQSAAPVVMVPVTADLSLPLHVSGREFPTGDMLVPWKKANTSGGETVPESCREPVIGRYYHLFSQGELDGLVARVPSLMVEQSFYEQGNWAVIVIKVE